MQFDLESETISHLQQQRRKSIWEQVSLFRDLGILFSNNVYLATMFGLVTLYFAAAGLQFWSISYMQVVMGIDPIESQATFIMALFTAMLPGVAIGGMTADWFGGYKGKSIRSALNLNIFYGVLCAIPAQMMYMTMDKTLFIIYLWFFFFFGACTMPIALGIITGCVPKVARNSA